MGVNIFLEENMYNHPLSISTRHVCTKNDRNQMIILEDMAEKVEICLTLLKFLINNENQSFFAANT